VGWGSDINVKDVNGFTALDAALLCNGSSIVYILKKRGAIALVLDGPSTKLSGVIMKVAVGHHQETALIW